MTEWNVSTETAQLHKDAHVWDMTLPWGSQHDLEHKLGTLERAAAYGHTLVSLTLAGDWQGMTGAIQSIARERAYFLGNPDKFVLVDRFADIEAAKRDGKLAIVFHFQGTGPVESDINLVETYHALGIRHMLMAYNCKNLVGDGCTERTDDGLSRFGVALIEEMNRVGMIVDATHTGHRTTMDMFEVSKDPVIFSHSNPSALWDIPRNIKDDQIKACAKTGGVVCINGVDIFLGMEDYLIAMMVKHMAYVAELVGPAYVGIGTDYVADIRGEHGEFEQRTGTLPDPSTPARFVTQAERFNPMEVHLTAYLKASGGKTVGPHWDDCYYVGPQDFPELTEQLIKHGFSEAEVRGILGENIMRVAKQVWR
jgi:membrane dipeptidase